MAEEATQNNETINKMYRQIVGEANYNNKHSQDNWKTKYKKPKYKSTTKAPMIFDGQNIISAIAWLSKCRKIKHTIKFKQDEKSERNFADLPLEWMQFCSPIFGTVFLWSESIFCNRLHS